MKADALLATDKVCMTLVMLDFYSSISRELFKFNLAIPLTAKGMLMYFLLKH